MRDKRKKQSLWLVFVFFLLITGALFYLLKDSRWDGKSRISLVLTVASSENQEKKPIILFSIEPRSSQAVYIVIPANVLLTVPYGYRDYFASSVYRLGQLDKNRGGGHLLSKAVENTLGLSVNGYLVSSGQSFPYLFDNKDILQVVKGRFFSIFGFYRNFFPIDTDFSLSDRIKLWWAILSLRTDQIRFYDLEKEEILNDISQPDGADVKRINTDLFDLKLNSLFEDSIVRRENVMLEVVNATEQEKVAASFGRILTHLGGTVILTSTEKKSQPERCLVYMSRPSFKSSKIVKLLGESFWCKTSDRQFDEMQSDVRIVIGTDFLK